MNIPRPEYPRPQFERDNWINLNGKWQFEIDNGMSGEARGLYKDEIKLESEIIVPFCPESKLSGVEHKDFMYGVWYKRSVELSAARTNGRTVLHYGAADYDCIVYVNEKKAGEHKGGYISFEFDVTGFVKAGVNTISVFVKDDTRDPMIPRGKQCEEFFSHGCDYTRTTGIWQTVWLEFTPVTYIKNIKFYPDTNKGSITAFVNLAGAGELIADIYYGDKKVGGAVVDSDGGLEQFTVDLSEKHLWEVGKGRLYDVVLSYGEDKVKSYFGLRSVKLDGMKFLLNGKSVFQRLILDQGFYPDGIYTAPDDSELLGDIKRSIACGFNGARLHEKIFEERFLYHCDKEGYIVWGEYPNWGLDHTREESIYAILPEWIEELERDFNHPAIIGWCPFNETWDLAGKKQFDGLLKLVYETTKAIDITRPCIDTSGNYHVATDIFDLHDYDQNPANLKEAYDKLVTENILTDRYSKRQHYNGEPVFISEYGGIGWSKDWNGWGYGVAPKSEEEYIARFCGMAEVLLGNEKLCGFCYTQLTDVEQELNGLYYYDRTPKFDTEIFRKALTAKAAIED